MKSSSKNKQVTDNIVKRRHCLKCTFKAMRKDSGGSLLASNSIFPLSILPAIVCGAHHRSPRNGQLTWSMLAMTHSLG